jgi:hypothetical protein
VKRLVIVAVAVLALVACEEEGLSEECLSWQADAKQLEVNLAGSPEVVAAWVVETRPEGCPSP